ncbi:exonuclease SbcCD subunit D [Mesorhizobium sp. ES1-3]|uniref:metallophosphoesterase family protein n=1 Tax=Mesorhizobium sp. ES1-3 TaxID=2876628 RepID=UPI001CC93B33|nr:DNA repair exonuclease [Mesorhizobium sp. ES1-3]MBZ9672520.1 DNA repair exonuclease [Mesorhizobium sp. ES1-3]
MVFRFVHTADIHLDSPLRSLAMRNATLAELVGDASRQAFVAIVDLCLTERVHALVIAGDLYDGDQTSMKTARFLASQMARLHQAGIRVYMIRGNHDAMSRITKQLILPDTVTTFGGRCQSLIQPGDGIDVAFHGLSFASPKASESLLPKYAAPQEGAANIGIMHTSLAGSPGHDVYAPCSVADLHGQGFDYWALGHIHVRQVYSGASTLVMPGIPQGRDINEAGEKSVTLVTVRDDRSVEIEERLTSVAQFERVSLDLTGVSEWSEAISRIRAGLEQSREGARSRYLVARLRLVGTSALSWSLMRDRDLAVAEAEQAAEQVGDTWVEKLELHLSASAVGDLESVADPTLELAQSMRANAGSEAFRSEAREFVLKTIADLPPDARGFAGKDEAGLERFLDDVLAGSVDLVTARLKAGATR